jgi:hypothetical protein
MTADKIRKRLVYHLHRFDSKKIDTIIWLLQELKSENLTRDYKRELSETLAELLFPDGIARIAEVIHPNGIIS